VHRVGQLVAHVRARVDPQEVALVRRVLPDGGVRLFEAMPVADRRHGLDVAERLLRSGHDDPELLGAALLHDVAKGKRMRLAHRVAGVLLEAIAPSVLRRLADPNPASWRHPFHLFLHHEPMSAELTLAAGCTTRLADFIRGVAETDADERLLRAMKDADDAS
jgi:hypothetical protein